MLRWVLAVAAAMAVAGVVEYQFAAQQLEGRIIAESTAGYQAELDDLEDALAANLAPGARQQLIDRELERISHTYGTQQVALFDDTGKVIGDR